MFKFNKHHIEKPKHEHERINFLIFDDIIGTITEFDYKKSSPFYKCYINNPIY